MELLTGPYTSRKMKPLVDKLNLPPVEVKVVLEVRKFNIGQSVPVIKAIPQADKILQAIKAIEKEGNTDLLARWDDYGCATYDQLKLMGEVILARNNFKLVQATVE
ncbi:hypothetical protein F442_04594 [Phytophthora nicotianae P10297]|uniref:Uncharacterized protein n=1 Tax=Phytophthora nicotianae P10297 TaxID=1317064 RepID=W2ZSI8_PHYNI|nr:hypothetical protein F442_04594 [Phytophthora nicotianae P10297]